MSSCEAVENSIIHRIRVRHLDLLVKHGPSRVLSAIQERASSLSNLEEISSSDVSCWVREIIEDLEREAA